MDRSLIERLAREAGFIRAADERGNPYETFEVWPDDLHRFAALVAEECAKLVEAQYVLFDDQNRCQGYIDDAGAAIRAKFALDSRQPSPSPTTD